MKAKDFYNTAEYPKSFAKLINTGITVNYENVFEFAEIYAKEFAKAELEKVKPKWISVNERLPEEGGRYWCFLEYQGDLGKSTFQWNCSFNEVDNTFSDLYMTDGEKVTHWMPLPEPPLTTKE